MPTVVAMADRAQRLDLTLDPLFRSYRLTPDRVEVLVTPDRYAVLTARELAHKNMSSIEQEDLLEELGRRGIPERDAMYFAQGLRMGRELIIVDTEPELAEPIAAYLQRIHLPELLRQMPTASSVN